MSNGRIFSLATCLFISVIGILIVNNLKDTPYGVIGFTIILPLIFIALGFGFYYAFEPHREDLSHSVGGGKR